MPSADDVRVSAKQGTTNILISLKSWLHDEFNDVFLMEKFEESSELSTITSQNVQFAHLEKVKINISTMRESYGFQNTSSKILVQDASGNKTLIGRIAGKLEIIHFTFSEFEFAC